MKILSKITPARRTLALRVTEVLIWAAVIVALAPEIGAAAKAALAFGVVALACRFVFRGGFTHRVIDAARDRSDANAAA